MAINNKYFYIISTLKLLHLLPTTISWDVTKPPTVVKALRDRNKNYTWCIDTLNNGGTLAADMHFLAVFSVDLVEGNSTWGIDYINKTLIPNEEDPYVIEVVNTCMDAFLKLSSVVNNKVDNYVFFRKYQQAKPWGLYASAILDACETVCTAKKEMKCPVWSDIYKTRQNLDMMNDAIELELEGVY